MDVSFIQHLLIDGANVLHAWPDLRAILKRDRAAARAKLVQRAAMIHDGEEVRVTVVFDGRGKELVIERPSAQPTLSVLYTPAAQTADDVIEQLVAQASDPATCLVATADRAERQTAEASGARVISPEELAAWIRRVEARQGARMIRLRRANDQQWRP